MRLGGAGSQQAVPMSVLRYAQRIPEPLVVTDATSDDRFAGDPYFADVDRCSLVALPILSRGRLRAVLLLENRLIRGAFTAERLDAVKLITGQLAVSLDNAQLYSELAASRARSSPPPIRPAATSNATCTTAPSSGLSRLRWSFAWRRPRCRRMRGSFGCDSTMPSSRPAGHLKSCVICRAAFIRHC